MSSLVVAYLTFASSTLTALFTCWERMDNHRFKSSCCDGKCCLFERDGNEVTNEVMNENKAK